VVTYRQGRGQARLGERNLMPRTMPAVAGLKDLSKIGQGGQLDIKVIPKGLVAVTESVAKGRVCRVRDWQII
jgi:hypothetical protein